MSLKSASSSHSNSALDGDGRDEYDGIVDKPYSGSEHMGFG
jgi:hypothetical protein